MRNALPCCLWCWFSALPHTQFCFYLCMLVNHTLVTCLKYTHTVVIKMGLVNWFWYMMLMKQPKGICWKGEGGDNGESRLYEVWLTSYSEKFLQVLWCKPFNARLILLTPPQWLDVRSVGHGVQQATVWENEEVQQEGPVLLCSYFHPRPGDPLLHARRASAGVLWRLLHRRAALRGGCQEMLWVSNLWTLSARVRSCRRRLLI